MSTSFFFFFENNNVHFLLGDIPLETSQKLSDKFVFPKLHSTPQDRDHTEIVSTIIDAWKLNL